MHFSATHHQHDVQFVIRRQISTASFKQEILRSEYVPRANLPDLHGRSRDRFRGTEDNQVDGAKVALSMRKGLRRRGSLVGGSRGGDVDQSGQDQDATSAVDEQLLEQRLQLPVREDRLQLQEETIHTQLAARRNRRESREGTGKR